MPPRPDQRLSSPERPRPTGATLRDVASLAGVSVKTVSRVVNGEAHVRDATAARVRSAVKRCGYVPNITARRLVTRRSFILGMVFQNKSWNWINDFQRGAIERGRQDGYEILMHPCHLDQAEEQQGVLRLVEQGSVDGLLLTPPCGDFSSVVKRLDELGAPHVRIAPSQRSASGPSVSPTDREGAASMTRHLLELGHRRIGFVLGDPAQASTPERLAGYRSTLESAGIAFESRWVRQGDFSFESGVAIARAWLEEADRPSAIFASNDDMAAGVAAAAHQRGLSIPDELSVAGFDDVALASQTWPPLTTVRQPTAEIARVATGLLIEQLGESPPGAQHEQLETTLIVRSSTGPAPCS